MKKLLLAVIPAIFLTTPALAGLDCSNLVRDNLDCTASAVFDRNDAKDEAGHSFTERQKAEYEARVEPKKD